MSRVINQAFDKGANSSFAIQVKDSNGDDLDMTGFTLSAIYKKHANSYANTIQTLETAGYSNGYVVVSMNSAISNTADWGRFYYYVTATQVATNTVIRIQEGILTIRP